jgi:hypothetical protein
MAKKVTTKLRNSRTAIVFISGFITCCLAALKIGNVGLAKTTIALAAMITLAGLVTQLYREFRQTNDKRLFLILLFIVILSILAIAGWIALATTSAGTAVCAWLLGRAKNRNRRLYYISNAVAS